MADKIGHLPVAATLKEGSSVSKYFEEPQEESFLQNVRESTYWADMASDPVFLTISIDCDYVLIGDLVQRRKELSSLDRNMDLESEEGELQETDEYQGPSEYTQDAYEEYPTEFENHENVDNISYEQVPQSFEGKEEAKTSMTTEEKLAALGVTGMAKPVHRPARLFHGPGQSLSHEESRQGAKRQRGAEGQFGYVPYCVAILTKLKV
jgi:hypothetical protein